MTDSINPNHSIGQRGEESARQFLHALGYHIRDLNYTNTRGIRLGEIDIVAEKKGEIIFVEVKAAFIPAGHEERLPEWQVQRPKLRKMERIARAYLREHALENRDYSFHVIAVTFRDGVKPEIRHLDHVFYS